jgi:glutathione S-transferase
MNSIELFSARVCPFAHRCRLALTEKHLDFKKVEIDLHNKPPWYMEVSPNGTVPTLRQGSFILQESLVINEYIDELTDRPSLMPTDIQQRATARFWIEFAGTRLIPPFYRLLKSQNNDDRVTAGTHLLTALELIDNELLQRQSNGPYWFGADVGLTDIAFYPWFERWPMLEHYRGVSIPSERQALLRWIETMQTRMAVKQNAEASDFYISEYAAYADGSK